jgi:nitrogen-specific signal transduction histidine kinase
MNSVSTNFNFFIEYDANPFVLFNSKGKIVYLNSSAEMLMGSCTRKKLFDVTLSYAPKSFGYKKTLIDLSFGYFEFYAINVLYENEEEIAIHLYNKPMPKINSRVNLEGYSQTDINLLFEANIELFKMQYNGKLKLITDYDLPKLYIHQNNFSFLIRKIFETMKSASEIIINIKIKIGELIIVNGKKYPIILFIFKSNNKEKQKDKEIKSIAMDNYINIHCKEDSIILEIPAIS